VNLFKLENTNNKKKFNVFLFSKFLFNLKKKKKKTKRDKKLFKNKK
jgi:hypothetical protein